MTIYLKDACYVDWNSLEFTKGHMAVSSKDGEKLKFLDTLPGKDTLSDDEIILDCQNRLVMKSFACGHHHIYSALARGMPAPEKIPGNFAETLQYIWWRLDRLVDMEMIKASALVTALYCLKNGVTFVIDHHSSPFAIEGSLETIAKAFEDVGISHLLCYEMSDRDGELPKENGLEESERYLENKSQGHVGLHASFTVGDDLLKRAVALAEKYGTGLHVHVAEDAVDQEHCMKTYKKRVVQRYADAGVLDLNKSILSHCIHLDEKEVALVRDSGVWVAQNTESNLNNNVGVTNYKALGENVILGTDGMHSDMLRSANADHYIRENGFEGDGDNNLVILDYDAPTEINPGNFLGHFIYGMEAKHVESVISSGRLVLYKKRLMTADEGEILTFAREMGNKLWDKMRS